MSNRLNNIIIIFIIIMLSSTFRYINTHVYCIDVNGEASDSSARWSTLVFGIRANEMPVTIRWNEWKSLGSPPFSSATRLFPPRGEFPQVGNPCSKGMKNVPYQYKFYPNEMSRSRSRSSKIRSPNKNNVWVSCDTCFMRHCRGRIRWWHPLSVLNKKIVQGQAILG